ncbi:MAG: right-handed parallel beta-helix repeat-containing protein [Chlamydiales bacterium]|nr:right-handed parallel beta-helix repeat-containing protein [Chlamydiales bacterium]
MNSIYRHLVLLCAIAATCIVPASGHAHGAKQHAYAANQNSHKKSHHDSSCSDCSKTHVITKEDFCHHGRASKTVVISKPGNYCLADTIHWSPKKRNKTAIIIDASNVTLDLSGHELKQVNSHGRCSGILVTTGHNTVKIINGAVRDFTQLGVVVEGDTSNIFLGNDDTVLKVTGCGYGSSFSFFDDVDEEAILQGGIQLGQSRAFEAQGYYTYQGQVNTAVLTNVFAEENGPVGIYFGIGSDITAQSCYFCRNVDNRMRGNPALGTAILGTDSTIAVGAMYQGSADFGDEASSSFTFLNCHFDENSAIGDTPSGIGFNAGYNINGLVLSECTFNSNSGTGATNSDGFGTYGCLTAGNKGMLIQDCQADTNFSEYFSEGFHHSGRNTLLDPETMTQGEGLIWRRCSANCNRASGSLGFVGATGYEFDFMLGLTVEECTSVNNVAITSDPNTYASVTGMILFGSTSLNGPLDSTSVSGCHIAGNRVDAPNGGDIEGIYLLSNFSNVVISNCVIQENVGAGFDLGIWIEVFDAELHNAIIQNCTIESENYGIYSSGDNNSIYQNNTITNVEYGVLLDGSSCNSVNNNYVTNAVNGFVDTANPSTSLFSNNKVFGAVTPYDVTYAFGPVPVVSGSLLTGFPTGAEVLDNVFMDNPTCTAPPVAAAAKAKAKAAFKAKADKARKSRLKRMAAYVKM